ncbi:ATP-dependent DNA ligase [Streptomyces sp. NPDC059743]|uniref:ATP-dependent DNA ligase n=1 Tax=Streptomyces sp. NPDC059743 TaxID=3346928 RepID=UPI00364E23A0
MHLSPPLQPMLARSVEGLPSPGASGRLVYEQKVDGFRALVFARPAPFIQSRRGADLGPAFPEIMRAASELGVEAVLDAELVVWAGRGLDFTALQQRARRRGPSAERAAATSPAHLVVFDLLELSGTVLMDQPLARRRALLEELFTTRRLSAPWALSPQTTDQDVARTWLDPAWGAVGVEGAMIKDFGGRYRPGDRGWLKARSRTTAEGIIAAVTGTVRAPQTLLLGSPDPAGTGRLRLIARSTPLSRSASAQLGAALHPAGPDHPWRGLRFSAGWGTSEPLAFRPVVPELVAEFTGDTAVDGGRYRHPVRYLRVREDMAPSDVHT